MRLAKNIRKQLRDIANDRKFQAFVSRQGSGSSSSSQRMRGGLFEFRSKSKDIRKAICQGFFMKVAKNCQQATYRTASYMYVCCPSTFVLQVGD